MITMDLRKKKTLTAIEQAFVTQVLAVGFSKVTIQQIATDAMINRKTFYDHFDDKYDLLNHVNTGFLKHYGDVIDLRLALSVEEPHSFINEQLKNLVTAFFGDVQLRQTYIALDSIHADDFDFQAGMTDLIANKLALQQKIKDPLTAEVITGITLKTLNYYARTNESFSLERQVKVFKNLRLIFGPELL